MSEALQAIITWVAPLLASAIGGTALWFLRQKLHLSLTQQQVEMTHQAASAAVHAAEEFALARAKRDGIKPSSREKLDEAAKVAAAMLARRGLPALAPPEMEALLHAELQAARGEP